MVFFEIIGITTKNGPRTVLLLEIVTLETFIVLSEGKPPKVKNIPKVFRVGEVFNLGRVKENSKI